VSDDALLQIAESLSQAWAKYKWLYGVPPHGTKKQLAAMLELCPQVKEAIRLWGKQRERGMTV